MGLLTLSLLFLKISSIKPFASWLVSVWFCFVFFVCLFVCLLLAYACLLFLILGMKVLKKTEEILKFEKKTVMAQTSTAIILQS